MLKRAWRQRSLEPVRSYVLVPAPAPEDFAREPLDDLADSLRTDRQEVARAILTEAEAIFQEPVDRIDSAERRATTLQGTVAIAASVVVAGAGLLLDPSKVSDQRWRMVFSVSVLAFVICLTASAIRALSATSRIFRFEQPGPQRIGHRASMSECDVLTHRAAELLRASEVANQIGRVKVGLLRSAAWWFRLAIVSLAVLAALIATYVIAGPQPTTRRPSTTVKGIPSATTASRSTRRFVVTQLRDPDATVRTSGVN
jgi:hypothetical protein